MTGSGLPRRGLPSAAVIAIVAVALVSAYFIFDPAKSLWAPKCLFHVVTGWSCPGCGSQRAIHAFLHLHFIDAVRYNALLVIFIPIILGLGYLEMNRNKYPRLYARLHSPAIIFSFVIVILGWGIVRNILNI